MYYEINEKGEKEYFVMDDGGRPKGEITPEMIKEADEIADQVMKEYFPHLLDEK